MSGKVLPAECNAGLAAFELGRLRMDRLGDLPGATQALRRAMAMAPGSGFREDAMARLVEAYSAMGSKEACLRAQSAFYKSTRTACTRTQSRAVAERGSAIFSSAGVFRVGLFCKSTHTEAVIAVVRRGWPGVVVLLWAVGLTGAPTPTKSSQVCGQDGHPWVSLSFSTADWPEQFQTAVLGDLKAGFASRGVFVCPSANGPVHQPAARVQVTPLGAQNVEVSVEVHNEGKQKHVSRSVDLANLPADGRAFAIALVADELVWASWAELAFDPVDAAPTPSTPGAAEQSKIEHNRLELRENPEADDSPEPTSAPRLVARGAIEHYTARQIYLGGDLVYQLPVVDLLDLELLAGLRQGLDVTAPHGTVESSAAAFGAGVRYPFLLTVTTRFDVGLAGRFVFVRFEGVPEPGASGTRLNGSAIGVRSDVALGLRLAKPLWLISGAGAGVVARAIEATDGGEVASGIAGVELFGHLGLGVEL